MLNKINLFQKSRIFLPFITTAREIIVKKAQFSKVYSVSLPIWLYYFSLLKVLIVITHTVHGLTQK